MIIKLGEELTWKHFVRKDKVVKALKMPHDFLVETSLGFLAGKRGDWVVEAAPGVRFPCSEGAFLSAYAGVEPETERRTGLDRRNHVV